MFLDQLSYCAKNTHTDAHTHTHTHRDSDEYSIVAFSKNATMIEAWHGGSISVFHRSYRVIILTCLEWWDLKVSFYLTTA